MGGRWADVVVDYVWWSCQKGLAEGGFEGTRCIGVGSSRSRILAERAGGEGAGW